MIENLLYVFGSRERHSKPTKEMYIFLRQISRGVEEAGCKIYSGAPTVSQTTG